MIDANVLNQNELNRPQVYLVHSYPNGNGKTFTCMIDMSCLKQDDLVRFIKEPKECPVVGLWRVKSIHPSKTQAA